MTDRPILFNAPMVRALLFGTKTQTRRMLKNSEYYGCPTGDCAHSKQAQCDEFMVSLGDKATKFAIGGRLWVKETYRTSKDYDHLPPKLLPDNSPLLFVANGLQRNVSLDQIEIAGKVRQSIFMQARFSRLTLIVTDVRVERLQDISEVDALAEGIVPCNEGFALTANGECWGPTAKDSYRILWDAINGDGAWESNPWIVAVSFNVKHGNIDND